MLDSGITPTSSVEQFFYKNPNAVHIQIPDIASSLFITSLQSTLLDSDLYQKRVLAARLETYILTSLKIKDINPYVYWLFNSASEEKNENILSWLSIHHQTAPIFITPEAQIDTLDTTFMMSYYNPPPKAIFFINVPMATPVEIVDKQQSVYSEKEKEAISNNIITTQQFVMLNRTTNQAVTQHYVPHTTELIILFEENQVHSLYSNYLMGWSNIVHLITKE